MTNEHALPSNQNRERNNSNLPWVLLAVVLVGLAAALWWGYNEREAVAQFAVSSLLSEELTEFLPEGTDPTRVAIRVAAIMRALNRGQLDAEQLKGLGAEFRQFYADRTLDRDEFEALLLRAEAAIEQ